MGAIKNQSLLRHIRHTDTERPQGVCSQLDDGLRMTAFAQLRQEPTARGPQACCLGDSLPAVSAATATATTTATATATATAVSTTAAATAAA